MNNFPPIPDYSAVLGSLATSAAQLTEVTRTQAAATIAAALIARQEAPDVEAAIQTFSKVYKAMFPR